MKKQANNFVVGVTVTIEKLLTGHCIRKAENHCSRLSTRNDQMTVELYFLDLRLVFLQTVRPRALSQAS